MALVGRAPAELPADRSHAETIEFVSLADGRSQRADLYRPADVRDEPLPLVIAPHPITWTAAEDYHGGLAGLKRGHHSGWRGLPDAYGVVLAMPHGHHRRVELCSLASPEQISDLALLVDEVDRLQAGIDRTRVYACGLSMGGLEALVVAGQHPDLFAAVVVFNPIVDLAEWQRDLASTSVAEIREFETAQRVMEEVGGDPDAVPDSYAERSAITYVDGLVRVPTLLFWSNCDLVVPRQESHHAYRLYRELKARGASTPVCEYEHTRSHGISVQDDLTRWQLHEWCDYELALAWLLRHCASMDEESGEERRGN